MNRRDSRPPGRSPQQGASYPTAPVQPNEIERFTPSYPQDEIYDDARGADMQEGRTLRRRIPRSKRPNIGATRRRYSYIVIVIGLIIIGLFTLPIPLGNVQISGSKDITVESLEATGQLGTPVNILQIRPGRLEASLAQDLRVEKATVNYVFPFTLAIQITERQPVLVVPSQFGYVSLDRNGVVIHSGAAITDPKVPIASGIKLGNILLGDVLDKNTIKAALQYLDALPADTRTQIAEVNVGDENNLIAYTVDGLPLQLGDTKDMEAKAKITVDMLKDLSAQTIQVEGIQVDPKSPYYITQ